MAKFQMYGRIIQLLRWKVDYTEMVRQYNDDEEVTETEQARTEYFASEAEADVCAERTGGTKSAVPVAQSDEWLDGLEVEDVPDTYSRAVEIAAMGQAAYKSKQTQTSSTVYNIGTANSSVFGNYNNVSISYDESLSNLKNEVQNSDSPDKEELQEIVALLEMIVNNKVPASKGIFSKFFEVMERNSWITGSIASTILSWLISHI